MRMTIARADVVESGNQQPVDTVENNGWCLSHQPVKSICCESVVTGDQLRVLLRGLE